MKTFRRKFLKLLLNSETIFPSISKKILKIFCFDLFCFVFCVEIEPIHFGQITTFGN